MLLLQINRQGTTRPPCGKSLVNSRLPVTQFTIPPLLMKCQTIFESELLFYVSSLFWSSNESNGWLREQGWKVCFWQKLSIDECVVSTGDERDTEKKLQRDIFQSPNQWQWKSHFSNSISNYFRHPTSTIIFYSNYFRTIFKIIIFCCPIN